MLSLDWLSGSIPYIKTDSVLTHLESLIGSAPTVHSYGQYRYDKQSTFEGAGITVFYDSTPERANDVHGGRSLVVCTGTGLQMLGQSTCYALCKYLVFDAWCKATRIDCAFDDYHAVKTPTQVWSDCCLDRHYTRFQKCGHITENGSFGTSSDTVTFGTRGKNGGGSYLRYYRKDLESDGEIDAYRWEVEFSKTKAQEALFALAKCPDLECYTALLGAFVGGSIDFVDRKDRNLSRATRQDWWSEILGRIGTARIRVSAPVQDVEKARKWVRKSVVGSLLLLEKSFGKEEFWTWLQRMVDCKHTLTSRQRLALREFERDPKRARILAQVAPPVVRDI